MALPGLSNLQRGSIPTRSGWPIAVDFGTTAMRVLQLGPGEPPALVAAASVPTPDNLLYDPVKRTNYQLDRLPRVLKEGGFKGKRAVGVIPGDATFCKHLQIGKIDGVKMKELLAQAVPAEVGCPSASLVLRHIEVPDVENGSGKSEVVCFASPKDFVKRVMDGIKLGKALPVGMHTPWTSLAKAVGDLHSADASSDVTTLCLDIGWARTEVVVLHGRSIAFARSIEIGGRQLDEAVRAQLKLELTEARTYRLRLDKLCPDGDVSSADGEGMALLGAGVAQANKAIKAGGREADLTEALEMLADEVRMCMRYHESLFPSRSVDRAVFVGGESRHMALVGELGKRLRVTTDIADPMARIARTGKEPMSGVDFNEPQPGWAVAVGACLCPTDL